MATPTQHKRNEEQQGRQMYSQIALYAAGNALSLFLFIILYQMNTVLSDFRDPMVYALLCSIALRAPKQKLMRIVDGLVQSDKRIVLYPFALLYAPVRVTQCVWGMLDEFLSKVQLEARKVAREDNNKGLSRRGGLKLYSDAIFRVLMSRKGGKKKKRMTKIKQKKASSDTILFGLACVCACWLVYEWIRDSWSKASQLALVSTLVSGFCISFIVSLVQMVSPWHFPSAAQHIVSPRVDHRRDAGVSSPLSVGSTSPLTPGKVADNNNRKTLFGNEESKCATSQLTRIRMPWKIVAWVISVVDVFDKSMKRVLKSSSHTLVSALLISALIVGTGGAVSFFTIQIIGEARDSLIAAKNVLSDPWSNGAQINSRNNGTSGKEQNIWERFPWLEPYHKQMAEFVDGSLPEVLSWLEVRGNKMLEMHNLTDAALEARYLIESLHGRRSCNAGEVKSMMISLAKARVDLKEKEETEEQTRREEQKLQLQLSLLLSSFQVYPGNRGNVTIEQDDESIEKDIVKTEAMLSKVQDELTAVSSDLLHARRLHQIIQNRLDLCSDSKDEETISTMADSNRRVLTQNFKQAYYKMVVDWRIAEGFQDIWESVVSAVGNFREADSSGSDPYSGIHIDSIQSFATAAMGPLIQISKAIMMSIESTTSAAFAGSLSIVKLGVGLLQFGMQSVLFLSLLFGLLSANDDPLSQVIKVLPFPPGARHRAAAVLNRSLGGVFVTLMKLALIHGLFTWVTFRIFDAPLVYTSSAISTVFALLPFFPQYTVAIPPLLALATQGRLVAGCILLLMHFSAANFFDDRILEEAGGNSYLMSLSLFGGMWAFYPNSVMGCLLGPIFLSLLYAFGALHVELMSDSLATQSPHRSTAPTDGSASLDTTSNTPNFTFTGLRSERSKKKRRQLTAQGSPRTPSSQVQQLVL
eukprot:jgi/Picsp_1/4075/NSC_01585-R1_protein